jgi:hypothetical protein
MGETISLFNPRFDLWEGHFEVEAESWTIQGITPCGRATVIRLKMNSSFQLRARRQWTKLGLFP